MKLPTHDLAGLIAAVSFAAGLNVYATVATLGVLGRTGVLDLPSQLQLLSDWPVIAGSGLLFAVEFFADKIPVFDLVWNALHTFIRVPIAAFLAYRATASLDSWEQLTATAVGGLIALAAHSGKTAARAVITPSPEPVSNMVFSLVEDVMAISLTWIATRHPYAAAIAVAVLLLVIIVSLRWVVRALRKLFRGAERALSTPAASNS
ncbi:MAG TPA: DUF4126 domain-containing protein [Terriglobales bacterium]|nr:DUF4126 domain-containing protein [Terriglobales bacterium]